MQTPPVFTIDRTVLIGMVHLAPLPGSPRFGGDFGGILQSAERDAEALVAGGADAIMLENFHDVPFYKSDVPRVTLACVTRAAVLVKQIAGALPVGVNVLRNDGRAALAAAVAADCDFIRVNVLCGARVTDQGVIEGVAADLLRDRATFGAGRVQIWADVDVKHSAPLAARPLEEEVADTLVRGLADALIVSGGGTGLPTDPAKLARVKAAAGGAPVLVGSGASLDTLDQLTPHADGLIVGTALQRDGRIDADRVRAFATRLRDTQT